MNIKILYDNEAADGFESGWGFSALINNHILFDTGENESSLMANIRTFNIEPKQIDRIVLSHNDWDHIGGVAILKQCGPVDVYLPSKSPMVLKNEIIKHNRNATFFEPDINTAIELNISVTATLGSKKREISLAVKTLNGLVIITGCAHPGLDTILNYVRDNGKIHAVVGGFHGFNNLDVLREVELIIPCHCTQNLDAIQTRYPHKTHIGYAGAKFEID